MRGTNTRRWAAAVAAVGLVAAGASACGSDSKDGSSKADTDISKVTFTGDPIKVLTTASYGNGAVDIKDPITVAQAAAAQINAKGGIAGHKLEVITCNDGADANAAAACARKAQSSGAVAEVGGISLNPDVVMPILEKAGIPWLGSQAVGAHDQSSKYSFPLVAGGLNFFAMGAKTVQDGCKSTAIMRVDLPVAAAVVQMVNGAIAKAGGQPATEIKVPPTATTFDSIAAQVAKHDCALVVVPDQGFLGIAAATRQAGGKTRFYTVSGTDWNKLVKQAGSSLDGTETSNSFPVDSDPAWDKAKAAAGSNVDFSFLYTAQTWVAYQALADVLKNVTAKTIDAKTVFDALNSATSVNDGGFTPPLNFTKEYPVPGMNRIFNTTLQYAKVSGGKVVPEGKPVNLSAAG